jgi:peptide/nickel transport system ATP-binding protein
MMAGAKDVDHQLVTDNTNQPALVQVNNLGVSFATRDGPVQAVSDVSFELANGETLGIVGESGSGKSVTSYALMRILDRSGRVSAGQMSFSGIDLVNATERTMRDLRGREISMIFQNPRMALNPIRRVGDQISDVLAQHAQAVGAEAKAKSIELLRLVKIRDAENRYNAYPFELSGGMCQRIVIALALACRPRLLIADEPTTGLDVTTQKSVMELIVELTRARGMSTILITHDLGLASSYCDRIVVMKDGEIVEAGTTTNLFASANHQYTRKLIRATPRFDSTVQELLPEDAVISPALPKPVPLKSETPVLEVTSLIKSFAPKKPEQSSWLKNLIKPRALPHRESMPRAIDDITFSIPAGGSVGLVGESGCGKSTTSSIIMRLLEPTSGSVKLDGVELTDIPIKSFAHSAYRAQLQMVFQDPTDSLNPRFTARRVIEDPIRMLGSHEERKHIKDRVNQLAERVGLPHNLLGRFPHQLSGGQKARVGIARAIALSPKLLILDEPTAALDVSVQAIVLNLLQDLRTDFGMSYLFVSHDLNVVRLLCDDVIVMQAGRIVETGTAAEVLAAPKAGYTQSLVDAIPHPPASFVA